MSSLFDTEDDLSLRTRRGAEDRAASRERSVELDDAAPADREVTLNTGTVLALFFTLALICAVFFGFGFSMGRKSNQAPLTSTSETSAPEASAPAASDVANSKPAPGSPAIQPIPGYLSQSEADTANNKATAATASHTTASDSTPAVRPAKEPATVPSPAATSVVKTPAAAPAAVASTTPVPAGGTYVQIAAVSHQEDADVLKSALGRRGYKVVERTDATDRLIHVQIGPFSDRKSAEATRQKLLSDGYNAFLK